MYNYELILIFCVCKFSSDIVRTISFLVQIEGLGDVPFLSNIRLYVESVLIFSRDMILVLISDTLELEQFHFVHRRRNNTFQDRHIYKINDHSTS